MDILDVFVEVGRGALAIVTLVFVSMPQVEILWIRIAVATGFEPPTKTCENSSAK